MEKWANRMIDSSPAPRLPLFLLCLGTALLFVAGPGRTEEEGPKKFPANSPEHQALTASSPYLGNAAFTMRNDYWKGSVSTEAGTALKLQFFKGNSYRLFFGSATDPLPAGATLHLNVFDSDSKEVMSASGEPGKAAVVLNFEKVKKTDLYLILMRIEPRPGPSAAVAVPSALFYGWE